MVHLTLSSTKGNQGLRYFPYSGYLGFTPVKVEGVVRTKVDDDPKPLQAKSITISIRCYESRLGRVSVLHSNVLVDYTQVLWTKPDDVEYAPINNLEFPFRITIPPRVAGFSTFNFVDYRCTWRVEAVLNHIPISHIGSRQIKHFELPLIRFDLPPHPPPSSDPPLPLFLHQTTKPRAPRLRYCIIPPTSPIGPLDLVSIPIYLLPMGDSVTIRSATVIIERHIVLNETTGHPETSTTSSQPISFLRTPSQRTSPSSSPSSSSYSPTASYQEPTPNTYNPGVSVASDSSSNPTITPNMLSPSTSSLGSQRSLLTHNSSTSQIPSKVVVVPIVGAESSGPFVRDAKGVWSKTITFQWPAAKPHSRWAIGETIQSDLASVKFFVRVKVVASSPSGTESIDLSDAKELLVVSTNEGEREVARTKLNEAIQSQLDKSGRSKSKSPRRTRRDRELDVPPSPGLLKAFKGGNSSTASINGTTNGAGSSSGSTVVKAATPRRPHTSAGPRDRAYDFAAAIAYNRERNNREKAPEEDIYRKRRSDVRGNGGRSGDASAPAARPSTSQGEKRRSGKGYSFFSSPRMTPAFSGSSTGTSASGSGSVTGSTSQSTSSISSSGEGEDDRVREWEEELEKIEMRSRRSSDMLNFFGKRKRSTGALKLFESSSSKK